MSNLISVDHTGGATVIRFTNPAARNPLSRVLLDKLYEVMGSMTEPVIFTGTGSVFASGANLNEIANLDLESVPEFARYGQGLMAKLASLPQTTVAAVNGHCFGGALDLSLSCDIRIASPDATFAHPGAGLGIITGWGGTQMLPRLVGTASALEMFFTAEPINALRALKIGLVDEVAVNPVERALEIVSESHD